MYDKRTNKLSFPHVIPTPYLGGIKYTMNSINGGTTRIADFNLESNGFWGGNVIMVGMINELGFYGCPDRYDNSLKGFYVHDGKTITELGKKLLEDRFKGIEIVYDDVPAQDRLTEEEIIRRNELRKEALDMGIAAVMIDHTTAKELEGYIKAFKSGEAKAAIARVEQTPLVSYADDFLHLDESGEERSTKRSRSRLN